jgi:hypothetical protein
MSFMSPSYVLQDGFNASWSRLATRYTLWMYREVGWDVQVGFCGAEYVSSITQQPLRVQTVYPYYSFLEMLVLPIKSAR